MSRGSPQRCAFTLTEFVVVLAVVLIVVLLVGPWLNTRREKAQRAGCADNLRQIGMALHAYAHDHQMRLPSLKDNGSDPDPVQRSWWNALRRGGYAEAGVFRCPADVVPRIAPGAPRSYALAMGADGGIRSYWIQGSSLTCRYFTVPAQIVVVAERIFDNVTMETQYSDGFRSISNHPTPHSVHVRRQPLVGNYLFLDGHVEWLEHPSLDFFPPLPVGAGHPPCP